MANNEEIVQHYLSETITIKDIAKIYDVTPRTIQRIIKKFEITQTRKQRMKIAWQCSDAIKQHVKLCKANAKQNKRTIKPKTRLFILQRDNYMCQFCGAGKEARLCVDHIDENADNNNLDNLRVLCMQCNLGRNTFMEKIYGKQE
jgi:5-methylcytosine-specific restriction endonuclease McrA